jgi:imidazole glycerol-phosphate synthase subunit HisF
MLTKRIIACLDVDAGRVVKGVKFENLRDAGDPAELAKAHSESGADEIVLLDISAAHQRRATLLDTVHRAARQLFIPFTVGGGIRTLEEAAVVFSAGADKISINSTAIENPSLITKIAERFGSQAVVVAIDAKRCLKTTASTENDTGRGTASAAPIVLRKDCEPLVPEGKWEAFVRGGRLATGRDAVRWAREAESRGAGEILLTSMDRDGTATGFDCELTKAVSDSVRIPVIASGGAGGAAHFTEVFREGHADAALAASIFHYGFHRISDLKEKLASDGIPMRWPC